MTVGGEQLKDPFKGGTPNALDLREGMPGEPYPVYFDYVSDEYPHTSVHYDEEDDGTSNTIISSQEHNSGDLCGG